jgi:hypothetical protein
MPWALPTFGRALLPARAGNHGDGGGAGERAHRGGQDSGVAGAIRPAPPAPDRPGITTPSASTQAVTEYTRMRQISPMY